MMALCAVGQRFDRLVVLEPAGFDSVHRRRWLCECDCGTRKVVAQHCLRQGHTRSCGCLQRDGSIVDHGEARRRANSPEYRTWARIVQRCHNRKYPTFKYYGDRGITVCDRWRTFVNFLADMGRRPSSEHSIERKNNNLGYEPGNCEWAIAAVQMRNTRRNRLVTAFGETHCLAEWAELRGIDRNALRSRLNRGVSPELALSMPSGSIRKLLHAE